MTNDILEFHILTDGNRNGELIYIHRDDIRRVASIEVKSESTYIVGQSKMLRGSILFLHAMSGPATQSVQETPAEIVAALGGARKVENMDIRQANAPKIEKVKSLKAA